MDQNRTVMDWVGAAEHRMAEAGVYLGHGTETHWDEAVVLVCHALALDIDNSASAAEGPVSAAEGAAIDDLLSRRINERMPAPYLTGTAMFAGLSFVVNDCVLIPRSPIAELIEDGFYPWLANPAPSLCDLCTGSGCIGIAAALHLPESRVVAVDISDDALQVARQNVEQHGVSERVTLLRSDLFTDVPEQRFDLIVSNPPYVADDEWRELPQEYLHEPSLALLADNEGLDLVLKILLQAGRFLTESGVLVVEVGSAQTALERRLPDLPATWLEFEHGGEGVFLLEASHLSSYRATLANLVNEPQ